MSDNWIVANLQNAFNTWNAKMAEIWSLVTTSPQDFKDGAIWNIVEGINGGLQAIGYGLLVLFFAMSIVMVGELTQIVLYITIDAKTKDEMITKYFFGRKQKEALETLLENGDAFTGTMQSLAISDVTAKEILENLPEDLSEERKMIVKKACSLVGKVTYFWGGKSSCIGWDSEWGKMRTVTATGSVTTGQTRPFGLDCSGILLELWDEGKISAYLN